MSNLWTNFGKNRPNIKFTNDENVQNNRFFAAGSHVFQSIKPIINPIRLLYKVLMPVKFQGSSSNRLGAKLFTTFKMFVEKEKKMKKKPI